MSIYSKISGIGSYLPNRKVSNLEISKTLDTSDEWILDRTGIRNRHIINEAQTSDELGFYAALKAIESSSIKKEDIDLIIVATSTSENIFPSTACLVQKRLKLNNNIPAFDISVACSGFIYALSIADNFIKSGTYQNILIIGSECMSKVVDWNDRSTCILFGDGAGAVILSKSHTPGIIDSKLISSASHNEGVLKLQNSFANEFKNPNIQMNGKELFKIVVQLLEESINKFLDSLNVKHNELDWVIMHQANIRISHLVADRVGIAKEKLLHSIDNHGNTSSASIPIVLDKFYLEQIINPNDKILLVGFGAGISAGLTYLIL